MIHLFHISMFSSKKLNVQMYQLSSIQNEGLGKFLIKRANGKNAQSFFYGDWELKESQRPWNPSLFLDNSFCKLFHPRTWNKRERFKYNYKYQSLADKNSFDENKNFLPKWNLTHPIWAEIVKLNKKWETFIPFIFSSFSSWVWEFIFRNPRRYQRGGHKNIPDSTRQ